MCAWTPTAPSCAWRRTAAAQRCLHVVSGGVPAADRCQSCSPAGHAQLAPTPPGHCSPTPPHSTPHPLLPHAPLSWFVGIRNAASFDWHSETKALVFSGMVGLSCAARPWRCQGGRPALAHAKPRATLEAIRHDCRPAGARPDGRRQAGRHTGCCLPGAGRHQPDLAVSLTTSSRESERPAAGPPRLCVLFGAPAAWPSTCLSVGGSSAAAACMHCFNGTQL